jgi:hypothetical protein
VPDSAASITGRSAVGSAQRFILKIRFNLALHAGCSGVEVEPENAVVATFCDNRPVLISMSLTTMKKWLVLCACFIAMPAFAENWVRYAEVNEVSRYYDKLRMVNMSGNAFIWDLQNLRTPMVDASGKAYQSVLYPTEFSCRKHQRRILSTHKMSDSMGAGTLITEQNMVGNWVDVVPHTPDDHLMRAVCDSQ